MSSVSSTGSNAFIDSLGGSGTSKAVSDGATTAKEASERFLKLLVTQLQNQDPMNPVDNAQMTSQMAQISTVSGIEKLNTTVERLNGQFVQMQAVQGAGLVGKDVLIQGDRMSVVDGTAVASFELASPASRVKVEVLSPAGRLVDTINLATTGAGRHDVAWAAGQDLPDVASYRFRITAMTGSTPMDAISLTRDKVGCRQHRRQFADGRARAGRPRALQPDHRAGLTPRSGRRFFSPGRLPRPIRLRFPRRVSMSFQQGVSGLTASARNLEVIGNNVANASTVGAKVARAEFADVYARAVSGGASSIGLGVSQTAVTQQFSQGSFKSTDGPLDIAINGGGFFQLKDLSGNSQYTRNGQFKVDRDGFVVNTQGARLLGYPANDQGVLVPGQAQPLSLPTAGIKPSVTKAVTLELNLDARAANTFDAGQLTGDRLQRCQDLQQRHLGQRL